MSMFPVPAFTRIVCRNRICVQYLLCNVENRLTDIWIAPTWKQMHSHLILRMNIRMYLFGNQLKSYAYCDVNLVCHFIMRKFIWNGSRLIWIFLPTDFALLGSGKSKASKMGPYKEGGDNDFGDAMFFNPATMFPSHRPEKDVRDFFFVCVYFRINVMITRRSARYEQTMKLGGQALFVKNALPLLSIVQTKRGAAPPLVDWHSCQLLVRFCNY